MKRFFLTALLVFLVTGMAQATIPRDPVATFRWSQFNGIIVADSFMIGAGRDGLMVFGRDSDGFALTPLGQLYLDTEPFTMQRFDSVLVVISRAHQIYFVDLNQLPHLSLLGDIDLGVPFHTLALRGNYLYVSREFDGLFSYRLDHYQSAALVDSSRLGVHYLQTEIDSDTLLALDDYNGVLSYKIDTSGTLTLVNYVDIPFRVTSFVKQDSILSLATTQPKLLIARIRPGGTVITDSIKTMVLPRRMLSDRGIVYLIDSSTTVIQPVNPLTRRTGLGFFLTNVDTNLAGQFVTVDTTRYLSFALAQGGIGYYRADSLWNGLLEPTMGLRERGAVTGLAMTAGKLFLSSDLSPLEEFSIQPDGVPQFEKTVFGALNRISWMDVIGDTILVTYPQIRRSVILRVRPDSNVYEGAFFLDTLQFSACKFNSHKIDTLRSAFLFGQSKVTTYTVSDSFEVHNGGSFDVIGRIRDIEFLDSVVAVCTGKGIWFYRIFNDFSFEYRSTLGLGEEQNEIMPYGPDLAVFTGRLMLRITASNPFLPTIDTLLHLPWPLAKATQVGRLVYGIGERGICVIDVGGPSPMIIDSGGRGGYLIAAQNGLVVTSDSNTVRLYDLSMYPTGVKDSDTPTPRSFALDQNYPNPFNPSTTISYTLPQRSHVELTIYNLLGQEVSTLVNEDQSAGSHRVVWSGDRAASGVYFYRLTTGQATEARKMILLK